MPAHLVVAQPAPTYAAQNAARDTKSRLPRRIPAAFAYLCGRSEVCCEVLHDLLSVLLLGPCVVGKRPQASARELTLIFLFADLVAVPQVVPQADFQVSPAQLADNVVGNAVPSLIG